MAVAWLISLSTSVWGQSAVWQPPAASTGNIYYNGGNVGIGTAVPVQKLDVNGNSAFRGWINIFNPTSSGSHQFVIGPWYSTEDLNIVHSTNGFVSHSGYLTIQGTTGNVGIGTTQPGALLHVKSQSGDAYVNVDASASGGKIWALMSMGAGTGWAQSGAGTFGLVDGSTGSTRLVACR